MGAGLRKECRRWIHGDQWRELLWWRRRWLRRSRCHFHRSPTCLLSPAACLCRPRRSRKGPPSLPCPASRDPPQCRRRCTPSSPERMLVVARHRDAAGGRHEVCAGKSGGAGAALRKGLLLGLRAKEGSKSVVAVPVQEGSRMLQSANRDEREREREKIWEELVQKSFACLYYNDFLRNCSMVDEETKRKLAPYASLSSEESYQSGDLEKASQQVAKSLYKSKVQPTTLIPKQVGNMYTASLSAFASVIHNRHETLAGQRILMFSYGSGLTSTMFSFKINEGQHPFSLLNIANIMNVSEKLEARHMVGTIRITEALSCASQELLRLELYNCGLTTPDFAQICTNLSGINILALTFAGNPINLKGCDAIHAMLVNPHCSIRSLTLDRCNLGLTRVVRIICKPA